MNASDSSFFDARRINLGDMDQIRMFTEELGISPDDLVDIVAQVGNNAANVVEHLLLRRAG